MKDWLKKIWWLIPCATVMIVMVCFGLHTEKQSQNNLITFRVCSAAGEETVTLWDNENGERYLFLPSYANLEDVAVKLKTDVEVTLDGKPLNNGEKLSGIDLDKEYVMTVSYGGNEEAFPFSTMKSGNVDTMYVNTLQHDIDWVFADKNNSETVSVSLYRSNGELNYSGRIDTIKGRGNSTWRTQKKPLLLKLNTAAELLDMGKAKNWVLLSNPFDDTCLRNKLVYDLAAEIMPGWTPQCRFVDLFLNGEYAGLYLLTEKVEVAENRLSDGNSSICLATFDDSSRTTADGLYVALDSGRVLKIESDKYCSADMLGAFNDKMQAIENCLMNDGALSELADMDSWAKRYLIDEVFLNTDADKLSSYYYWDSSGEENKVFAGPVWDYDLSMGNNNMTWPSMYKTPDQLLGPVRPWYSKLTENTEFKELAARLYFEEVRPLLCEMIDKGIDRQYATIEFASQMDSVRWKNELPAAKSDRLSAKNDLKEFLECRLNLLDSLWDYETEFCIVKVYVESVGTCCYAVPKGECVGNMPDAENLGIEGFSAWYDETLNEIFDPTQPITEDKFISAVVDETEVEPSAEETETDGHINLRSIMRHKMTILYAGFIAVFGTIMLIAAVKDYKMNLKSHKETEK